MSDTLIGLIITLIFIVLIALSNGTSIKKEKINKNLGKKARDSNDNTEDSIIDIRSQRKIGELNQDNRKKEFGDSQILNNGKPDKISTTNTLSNRNVGEMYPSYISEKLTDHQYMNSIIEESYSNIYIDLKSLHKKLNQNGFLQISISDLENLNLSKDKFWSQNMEEFWLISFNNLNYIFNGNDIIPCTRVIRNDHGTHFGILYIPIEKKYILKGNFTFDAFHLYKKIIKSIEDELELYEFLENLNYYYQIHDKPQKYVLENIAWVTHSKLSHKIKMNILNQLNSLDFVTQLYLLKNSYFQINLKKLLFSLYNLELTKILDIVNISDTSREIIKQNEVVTYLINHFDNDEDIFSFFEFHIIEKFVEEYFPMYHFKKKVCVLNHDIFHFQFNSNVNTSKRNHANEKFLKQKLDEFKSTYYKLIREKLRNFENELRVSRGYNIVGTFTNESILFNKVKDHFTNTRVISQGSPDWLGRQRIDIYFPDINIGIEYHGDQHFLPIKYFGGEEGLIHRQELDKKKERLCKENNCKLFIVDKQYDFESLKIELEEEIFLRKK